MATLFEYGDWLTIEDSNGLNEFLTEIWKSRILNMEYELIDENDKNNFQPFLKFDSNKIKANNYIGFIQQNNDAIEIYPKVFKRVENVIEYKNLMLRHIFYWFSYCRKWKFPFTKNHLDHLDTDNFPELIINLIANQFYEVVSQQPLTQYQQFEEELYSPKGRINFHRYLNNNLVHANYHKIDCDYEPFLFDNKVNKIIKYCTRLLTNKTQIYESQRILQEVLFILDEVEDTVFTSNDIRSIKINSYFDDYEQVLQSCHLILSQQIYSHNYFELPQWALLFPMDYVFEDFVAGFIEKHFSQKWRVEYQKSEMYLAQNEEQRSVFQMQHDIFLTNRNNTEIKIIIDTKYKLREELLSGDAKRGIVQNDMYQMTSYAFRRGCKNVILIYPNCSEEVKLPDSFTIESGFNKNDKINVTAVDFPFWSINRFENIEILMINALNRLLNTFEK